MALAIEALTVTMICKGCVLVSWGSTGSISKSTSVVVAAAVPWTVERSAAIVVPLLISIATVWRRLVRRPVSRSRVIMGKLVVVGVHGGSGHIILGMVLKMLSSGQYCQNKIRQSTYLKGICVIVRVCESDNPKGRIDTFWVNKVFNSYALETT
jgi:hypothetical protein